jgi:hypothetical protein
MPQNPGSSGSRQSCVSPSVLRMELEIDTQNRTIEPALLRTADDRFSCNDDEAVSDSKQGTPSPKIYELDPLSDPRWQAFVERHPSASVFHTTGWLEGLRRTYGYAPVVFTSCSPTEELKNGLLFCRIRSWITGSRIVSLPFSDHCEPLVGSPGELSSLVDRMQAAIEHQDWKYLEIRPVKVNFNPSRAKGDFQAAKLYYWHRLDLRSSIDDIFLSFHKASVQRRIRHAERANLICECGRSDKLLKDFYGLLLLTRRRHLLPPQPFAWFKNLVDCMGESLEIRVAYEKQIPTDAILTLRFRDTVYYKYGCSDRKFKKLGATTLLLWKAIQDAKAGGAKEFDLGRSEVDNKGLVAFKDHWANARAQMVYWRYPATDILALTEDQRLKIAKRIFAWVPYKLLELTGKLIYRHIG